MTTRTAIALGPMAESGLSASFFDLLKPERIRRRTYKARERDRQDIFDDIEISYDPKRKHARNEILSPGGF